MNEQDYYDAILEWFQEKKSFDPKGKDYKLDGLGLLTADVLAQNGNHFVACELKNTPYPFGSQGWGSVGQALALRRKAHFIYIGCVASDDIDSKKNSWKHASSKRTVRALFECLEIQQPESFEEYLQALKAAFSYFFEDLGIGLLVVHESYSSIKGASELNIEEVVRPKDTYLAT